MSDEKTEEPTHKKLDDARNKGQTHHSPDLNAAATLLAATLVLAGGATQAADRISKLLDVALEGAWHAQNTDTLVAMALDMSGHGLAITLPFIAATVAVALAASAAQAGLRVSFDPVAFKFEKLNPVAGLKRLVSVRSLVDFLKMLAKALVLSAVVAGTVRSLMPMLVGASLQPVAGVVSVGWDALLWLMGGALLVFAAVAPLDAGLQRWLFLREQRMSKDEVKREYKDMEGDPLIKGMRRQLAHEIANGSPQSRVPRATVVVTNPTHYAVALHYEAGRTALPVIVAKGADAQAALIRRLATEHRVPIVGNPPLARALFKLPLDQPVPEPLFEAVAAVLRWVQLVDRLGSAAADGLGAGSETAA